MLKKITSSILLFSLLIVAGRAETKKFTRPAMLQSMAANCIVAGLNEMADSSKKLAGATQKLRENPSTNSLIAAQQSWIGLQLAYKRNAMLTRGPDPGDSSWTMLFFPEALSVAIENIIRSPKPINSEFIEILGSVAKGSMTTEYLLFDLPQGAAVLGKTNAKPRLSQKLILEGPTAERRRLFVYELARDLETRLSAAAKGANSPAFIPKFVAGDQDSVNLLVNQVINSIETEVIQRLHVYTNQLQAAQLRYDLVEGTASGISLSGMKAALEGARRFYAGANGIGIDDYVQHVNPDLATRVEEQFKVTTRALEAIKSPLCDSLLNQRPTIDQFIEETRVLERLLKLDAVSALGVTIMFGANDGD